MRAALPVRARRRSSHLAWKVARHAGAGGDLRCVKALLPPDAGVRQEDAHSLFGELAGSGELRAALASPAARTLAAWTGDGSWLDLDRRLALEGRGRGRALFLYVTTRILRPTTVVETGCFTGWDSAVLLQALARNGHGRLYTIDLPADVVPSGMQPLPGGLEPGCLVPDELAERWTLMVENVRQRLPSLLSELGPVQLFFHDSDHSYAHAIWEYASVWPHLDRDGILVSDDIAWSTAFRDFATGVGAPVVVHRANPNVGALRRRDPS